MKKEKYLRPESSIACIEFEKDMLAGSWAGGIPAKQNNVFDDDSGDDSWDESKKNKLKND